MKIMYVAEKTIEELNTTLLIDAMNIFEESMASKQKKSLLVEGEALTIIFEDQKLKDAFLKISKDCESVVCCRVSPK